MPAGSPVLFPGRAMGAITGAAGAASGFGAAVGPWLAGCLFDQTGGCTIAHVAASGAIVNLGLTVAAQHAAQQSMLQSNV